MNKKRYIDEIVIALKKDNDDAQIDERLISRWLDSQRALFIKNKINQGETIEDNITQTIHNIRVEVVSSSMNDSVGATGRYLKTAARLPKFIECTNRVLLTSVRIPEIDGYEISTVSRSAITSVGNGVFNTSDIYGFLYNNDYYIKIPEANFKASLITHITIDGVFETPEDVGLYRHTDGSSAYEVDIDDYPISDTIWEYLLGSILDYKSKQNQMFRKDLNNDGRDSSEA